MKILFATGNESKGKRFSKGLSKYDIEVLTLKDIDIDVDVEEDGKTAIENALIKARAYSSLVDMPVLAMDDTLYIEGIPEELQPGLFVRRVNGKRLNDEEMVEHYKSLVEKYDGESLHAHWEYGMALIVDGIEYTYSWRKKDFIFVSEATTITHPGYPLDSISKNIELDKYFTEMTDEDKLATNESEEHVVDFIKSHLI